MKKPGTKPRVQRVPVERVISKPTAMSFSCGSMAMPPTQKFLDYCVPINGALVGPAILIRDFPELEEEERIDVSISVNGQFIGSRPMGRGLNEINDLSGPVVRGAVIELSFTTTCQRTVLLGGVYVLFGLQVA